MGVDGGIKKAFAAINLKGELIGCWCGKNRSHEEFIERICNLGIPVLIAGDTCPPSHFTRKIAARLNVKLSYPKKSLTKEEKKQIGKEIKDEHIRDAYAAAIKAYRKHSNRLRQIENMDVKNKEKLKKMIIEGKKIGDIVGRI